MAGRFSPSRGQFGIITCRSFAKKELFIQRCRDTANDQRGFILPLDDDDLRALVDEIKGQVHEARFEFLYSCFAKLVM
jgi:hypothetical protein